MRANFGLRHERPKNDYFREMMGVAILGNTSVFFHGTSTNFVSALEENRPGWTVHLIPDDIWEPMSVQFAKAMRLSETRRGTEYMVCVDGVWKFTKRILIIIYQDAWSFCKNNKAIYEFESNTMCQPALQFADLRERDEVNCAYVQSALCRLIWLNCSDTANDQYSHHAVRLACVCRDVVALLVPAIKYNEGLMKFLETKRAEKGTSGYLKNQSSEGRSL